VQLLVRGTLKAAVQLHAEATSAEVSDRTDSDIWQVIATVEVRLNVLGHREYEKHHINQSEQESQKMREGPGHGPKMGM
jgi:hypothetical protein